MIFRYCLCLAVLLGLCFAAPTLGQDKKGGEEKKGEEKKEDPKKKKTPKKKKGEEEKGKEAEGKERTLVVVVNVVQKKEKFTLDRIRRIFLKKSSEDWIPIDRKVKKLQADFMKQVLKMDDQSLKEYWLKARTMGGERPPRSYFSVKSALRYVSANTNSISYYHKNELTAKRMKRYKKYLDKIAVALEVKIQPEKKKPEKKKPEKTAKP